MITEELTFHVTAGLRRTS